MHHAAYVWPQAWLGLTHKHLTCPLSSMSTPSDYGAVHLLKENDLKQTELPHFHAFTLEYVFRMCTTEVGREDT